MAMREFNDAAGVGWLAWDIRPETSHPITRFEDYLQGYLDGWLVFETPDGRRRRRLHPIPRGWAELPDAELRALLDRAEPARPTDQPAAADASRRPQAPGDVPIRSFLYPGGRLWTVAEISARYRDPDGRELGDEQTVLRFSAGRRTLDLLAWPRDWREYDEAQLADLLYRAFPRRTTARAPDAPARRRSDSSSAQ
jgi:hypothetical protein